MRKVLLSFILVSLLPTAHSILSNAGNLPDSYKVVWNSPSIDGIDSMPLSGSHGAGSNVWVQDGSIWIYLGHNGAYDSGLHLLKLGCVRITPADWKFGGEGFTQTLDPGTGNIEITQNGASLKLWYSGETLIIDGVSGRKDAFDVAFGSWRDVDGKKAKIDLDAPIAFTADEVTPTPEGIDWVHRNSSAPIDIAGIAAKHGISEKDINDFVSGRNSGGSMKVRGGLKDISKTSVEWQQWKGSAWTGRTKASKKLRITISTGAGINADPELWASQASKLLKNGIVKKAFREQQDLWEEFWNRSHVTVNPEAGEDDPGFKIGRNYQLFRYMLACNRGGEFPLLFNGGIFTVDCYPDRLKPSYDGELALWTPGDKTPDYRRWEGTHFMMQNQRWLGWPGVAGGDGDLVDQSIEFYRLRAGAARARARTLGAEGVVYPEPLDVLGLCCVAPMSNGLCGAEHLTYHFEMMLQHAWMALVAQDFNGRDISADIPWILDVLRFFESFYRNETLRLTGNELDTDGKLRIYPSNELEFGKGATNSVETVCGLRRICDALLKQDVLLKDEERSMVQALQAIIPDIPMGETDGHAIILPARSLEKEMNPWEFGEMYTAFPYRIFGVSHPGTEKLLRDTYELFPSNRKGKADFSWMCNVANVAAMGWPEEAEKRAIYKMANNTMPQSRFPAFFGPGHDWLPDHNWGGTGMVGIQSMLMESDPFGDGKIYLLYSWPEKWDVDFKLKASGQATVSVCVKNGKVTSLNVTPKEREKDIVIDPRFK